MKIRFLVHAFLAALLVASLPGCEKGSCCPQICLPRLCLFRSGKKPPVYYTRRPYVLDYDPYRCHPPGLYCSCCCCEKSLCETCGYPFCACSPCRCEEPEYCWESSCSECRAGCSAASGAPLFEPAPPPSEYRISPGDLLEISVFQEEDTHIDELVVAPDGKVYYLFLDPVDAQGKTLPELSSSLAERLKNWYLDPEVVITPKALADNSFTILGRVNAPGLYPLGEPLSLRQAIGRAGGLVSDPEIGAAGGLFSGGALIPSYRSRSATAAASLQNSFIARKGEKLPVDFQALLFSADASQDLAVQPGDYIYIASKAQRDVFVLGNVRAPTALPFDEEMTLMQALAQVGGWPMGTPYGADVQNVLIVRGSLQCPCTIRVDLMKILEGEARDVCLLPGDIVYVHNKQFRLLRELVHLAVTGFIYSFVNEAGIYYAEELFDADR